MAPVGSVADEALTRRAQSGDVEALGLLLARHEPAMRTVAMSLLGYGPDADDAVQDASLTALLRIGDVRDPSSVGAWLRAVVRNHARMALRAVRESPGLDEADCPHLLVERSACPDQIIEQHAMRDWIWHALGELSQQSRLVLMLRYFSRISTYQDIAAACEVPVGTVRSRLSHAKKKMSHALLSAAMDTHQDITMLARESRNEAVATLEASTHGTLPREISELWPADTEMVGRLGRPGERIHPAHVMRKTLETGVRQQVRHVVASRDITIWEMDVVNPPETENPCPSSLAWIMFRQDRKVRTLRIIFPQQSRR
ncbi:sigma-70 family RNA polymerase sigma factor [Streptomyces sp. RS2]|uniref:RNA polymerase sigma factor n=1 Tax=Streptomyces sp. RS2 TaxID=1451205 RepID=UPI0021F913C1|nr:sigma-70 family RNA polymerase sigma factor [Streptomyces sp. RS2]MCW1100174.1 sigma-70 family RNA polymerase sigma factor [Streptomyces sp. RS2]